MKEIIKKRTIKVNGMSCKGCVDTINKGLSGIVGVRSVDAGAEGGVYVEYDLMHTSLREIEKKIAKLGYEPASGFFDRLKRGWHYFTEQNEADNMHAVPRSCCTIPESEFVQYERAREMAGKH